LCDISEEMSHFLLAKHTSRSVKCLTNSVLISYVCMCGCVCVRVCVDLISLLLMWILVMNRYGDHKTCSLPSGMCMYLFWHLFFDSIHFIFILNKYQRCLSYMKCLYKLGFNFSSFHYCMSLVIGQGTYS